MCRPKPRQVARWPACATVIRAVDAVAGTLHAWCPRPNGPRAKWPAMPAELAAANGVGMGRELFANMRRHAS
jgi:hypothetical protein